MQYCMCGSVLTEYFQDGITPLMYAAKQGHLEVVKTLVGNKQADVNIAEKVGLLVASVYI